jgi:hypothetical protein
MSKPLREVLRGAIASRKAAMRGSRGRRDWTDCRISISIAEEFGKNYPVADDQRVVSWCRAREPHVRRIVPKNHPAVYSALMGQPLKP